MPDLVGLPRSEIIRREVTKWSEQMHKQIEDNPQGCDRGVLYSTATALVEFIGEFTAQTAELNERLDRLEKTLGAQIQVVSAHPGSIGRT